MSLATILVAGWWALLALVALPPARAAARPAPPRLRLAAIVPAHNEERSVGRTVRSLRNADYAPLPDVVVVADNCTDQTARVACQAGARVIERRDDARRGKIHALQFAVDELARRLPPPDAVVVVDADTVVDRGFFAACAHRIERGAMVVQGYYAAGHAETDFARIRALALDLVHWTRPLGLERLGLPTTLKGNGMAFRWDAVAGGVPGMGIVEDAAATLTLANQGIAVAFEPTARVYGDMPQASGSAVSQDRRWEGGRLLLVRDAVQTARRALLRGDWSAAAAAADVASPPLSVVAGVTLLSLGAGACGLGSLRLGSAAAACLAAYVILGLGATRPQTRDLLALRALPTFAVHKLRAYRSLACDGIPREWVRTAR